MVTRLDIVGAWNNEVVTEKHRPVPWIWEGLIAAGSITLLTSAWKSGKSTLVSLLLDRRRQGGQLLDRPVRPGTTVVVTEEDPALWARRQERLDFGPHVYFCRPAAALPTLWEWRRFLGQLLELNAAHPFDLLIVDPLAAFLPGAENHAASLLRALDPLRALAGNPAGVLLLHHPRRAPASAGQAARGSGALPACADILLEMRLPPGDPNTRRRRLYGIGRYSETPARLLIELNPEGTDYAVLPDMADEDASFAASLATLCALLRQVPLPLTRPEILERWPEPASRPTAHTLWRWLSRGCALGVLARHGVGSRNEPFRYGLAVGEVEQSVG